MTGTQFGFNDRQPALRKNQTLPSLHRTTHLLDVFPGITITSFLFHLIVGPDLWERHDRFVFRASGDKHSLRGCRMCAAAAGGGCWSTLVLSYTDNTHPHYHSDASVPSQWCLCGRGASFPTRTIGAAKTLQKVSVTARRARPWSRVFGVFKR